jgi:hypothetical protein
METERERIRAEIRTKLEEEEKNKEQPQVVLPVTGSSDSVPVGDQSAKSTTEELLAPKRRKRTKRSKDQKSSRSRERKSSDPEKAKKRSRSRDKSSGVSKSSNPTSTESRKSKKPRQPKPVPTLTFPSNSFRSSLLLTPDGKNIPKVVPKDVDDVPTIGLKNWIHESCSNLVSVGPPMKRGYDAMLEFASPSGLRGILKNSPNYVPLESEEDDDFEFVDSEGNPPASGEPGEKPLKTVRFEV